MNSVIEQLLFIPLFFIISVPSSDPYALGFRDFQTVKGNKIKVSWNELRRVMGTQQAISMANEYWKYNHNRMGGYWLEHNTFPLLGGKAFISIDAVEGKALTPKVQPPAWKKAIKEVVRVASTPINLNTLAGIFGYQLVSI